MYPESCYFRDDSLSKAWNKLFVLRWPDLINRIQPTNWQKAYWETHLQEYVNYTINMLCLLLDIGFTQVYVLILLEITVVWMKQ